MTIKNVLEGLFTDKEVKLRGWVYRARGSGKIRFIMLRDSTGYIQITYEKSLTPDIFQIAKKLSVESAIEVMGLVKKDDRSPGGYFTGDASGGGGCDSRSDGCGENDDN